MFACRVTSVLSYETVCKCSSGVDGILSVRLDLEDSEDIVDAAVHTNGVAKRVDTVTRNTVRFVQLSCIQDIGDRC